MKVIFEVGRLRGEAHPDGRAVVRLVPLSRMRGKVIFDVKLPDQEAAEQAILDRVAVLKAELFSGLTAAVDHVYVALARDSSFLADTWWVATDSTTYRHRDAPCFTDEPSWSGVLYEVWRRVATRPLRSFEVVLGNALGRP